MRLAPRRPAEPSADGVSSRRVRILASAVLFALAAVAAGCSVMQGGASGESAPIVLQVENEYASDVQITALRSGGEVWRDQVRAFENRAFDVRGGDMAHATIQFRLEPRGSTASYVTTGVAVRPGDVVIVHIDKELRRSSATLR